MNTNFTGFAILLAVVFGILFTLKITGVVNSMNPLAWFRIGVT